jgi:hypothetical protein
MAQAVGQQISGLITPASNIVEGEIVEQKDLPQLASETQPKTRKKRSSRNGSNSSTTSTSNRRNQAVAIDWRHDPSRWGSPQQMWSTAEKSIWLLYVVKQETETSELPASQIAATFNKHFRQAGQINASQISRDLGRAKNKRPSLVAENTTTTPSAWYLTDTGIKRAEELVNQALGQV